MKHGDDEPQDPSSSSSPLRRGGRGGGGGVQTLPSREPAPSSFLSDNDDYDHDVPFYLPPIGKRLAPLGGNEEEKESMKCDGGGGGAGVNKDEDGDAAAGGGSGSKQVGSAEEAEDNFDNFVDGRISRSQVVATAATTEKKNKGGGGGGGEADARLKVKIMEMEEEQEELNNSLMSMTSHFAKVGGIFFSFQIACLFSP